MKGFCLLAAATVLALLTLTISSATSQEAGNSKQPVKANQGRGGAFGGGGFGGGFGMGFGGAGYGGEHRSANADPFSSDQGQGKPTTAPAPAETCFLVDADPGASKRLHEKLNGPIADEGIDFVETPLEEAIDLIATQMDAAIVINHTALSDIGIDADDPISVRLRNVKLGVALRQILRPLECAFVINDGVLQVTSAEEADAVLKVAVYPVRDLVQGSDYSPLVSAIERTIASNTWTSSGEGEGQVVAFPQRGCLIVSQTVPIHQELVGLLETLRKSPASETSTPQSVTSSFGGGQYGGGEHQGGFGGEYGGGGYGGGRTDRGRR